MKLNLQSFKCSFERLANILFHLKPINYELNVAIVNYRFLPRLCLLHSEITINSSLLTVEFLYRYIQLVAYFLPRECFLVHFFKLPPLIVSEIFNCHYNCWFVPFLNYFLCNFLQYSLHLFTFIF